MVISGSDIDYDDDQRVTYQGEPYTGLVREIDNETGETIAESNYLDGIEHGVSRIYYPGGQLKQERSFDRGRWHGPHRYWYNNGQLEEEIIFNHGQTTARHKWTPDGTPIDLNTE